MRPFTIADLEDRAMGETVYDSRPASERVLDALADDFLECREAIVRRIEWMSSQLLFTGSISYLLDDGTTETLEYGTPVEVTPAIPWSDESADPFKDLVSAADGIQAASGAVADLIVLGSAALDTFLRHPKVQSWMNLIRFNVLTVEPEERVLSAQFLGRLTRPYASLYSYVEMAEQESFSGGPQELIPLLPRDCVLIGSSTANGRTAFGSISQMESRGDIGTYRGERFVPLTLDQPEEQKRMFRLASRPCLIPSDLESWRIIKPLPGPTEPAKVHAAEHTKPE
jgi:hypothetical protein